MPVKWRVWREALQENKQGRRRGIRSRDKPGQISLRNTPALAPLSSHAPALRMELSLSPSVSVCVYAGADARQPAAAAASQHLFADTRGHLPDWAGPLIQALQYIYPLVLRVEGRVRGWAGQGRV